MPLACKSRRDKLCMKLASKTNNVMCILIYSRYNHQRDTDSGVSGTGSGMSYFIPVKIIYVYIYVAFMPSTTFLLVNYIYFSICCRVMLDPSYIQGALQLIPCWKSPPQSMEDSGISAVLEVYNYIHLGVARIIIDTCRVLFWYEYPTYTKNMCNIIL